MNIIDRIDALLDDDEYAWAFGTLCGLRDSIVRQQGTATDAQVQAIDNISEAGPSSQKRAAALGGSLPSDKFKGSRRYEGFRNDDKKLG